MSSDCPEYLRKAEKRLGEEAERVASYLDCSSEGKITAVVETELLGNQASAAPALFIDWWRARLDKP